MLHRLKSITYFLLKGNIFIACCAVALSAETSIVLNRSLHHGLYYSFIFFVTLFTYNLYYFTSSQFPYYKLLAVIGLSGTIATFFAVPSSSYILLGLSSFFSAIYLMPAFISIKKGAWFTVQKLILLIVVWVLITFNVPEPNLFVNVNANEGLKLQSANVNAILLLLWRIMLMTHLCLLFLIKDEVHHPSLKRMSIHVCLVLSILQVILAIVIGIFIGKWLGLICSMIAIVLALISRYFNTHPQSNIRYLFFVDGIMILEAIFVFIKYFYEQ